MARRGREVARGLEAVADGDARDHRELQSQGGAAGSLLLQQLDVALRFLPTSDYGTPAPAAGGAFELADMPTEGQAGGQSDEQDELLCSICIADYAEDRMCSTLPCGHVFHRACIAQWLRSGRMAGADCPLCKEPILQGALHAQVDAALGGSTRRGSPSSPSQARRPRLSHEDGIDAWSGPTAQEMDQMRAEAATGVAASMAADTEALGESLEFARTASALERMEVELERSASRRPPVARPVVVVGRQEAFRVRHVIDGDADGPMLVSGLDPDLVADMRASGLSMDEIGTHLGLQP